MGSEGTLKYTRVRADTRGPAQVKKNAVGRNGNSDNEETLENANTEFDK